MSQDITRTIRRTVTMRNLTPHEDPKSAGYVMHGDSKAEVEITETGVSIRPAGRRGALWRKLTWDEFYVYAELEK